MPQAVVAAAATAAFKLATGATIAAALTSAATTLVLGGLSTLLAPDAPSAPRSNIQDPGITRQIREPVTARRYIYGEARASGPITFISTTSNNKYLHLVISLADHEIEAIDEVIINEVSVAADGLDGSNFVNFGRYNGKVRIKKHLGTASQTADTDLVAEVTEWTTDHRGQGVAYLYLRLEWDREIWASGIPVISCWMKGKKIVETRELSTTRWSPNIPLIINDYLQDTRIGRRIASADISGTQTNASANVSDEIVTSTEVSRTIDSVDTSTDIITIDPETGDQDLLFVQTGDQVKFTTTNALPAGLETGVSYYVIVYQRVNTPRIKVATTLDNALQNIAVDITGTGTGTHTIIKTGEPRYHGGGVIKSSDDPFKIINDLAQSMAGKVVQSGPQWRILAGSYAAPTLTLTEDDLAGPLSVQSRQSRRDRFNRIVGVYASPINNGQPSDFPAFDNVALQTADGEVIARKLNLPHTPRAYTAQRIAKIATERFRQEIIVSADWKLNAFQLQVGDNVNLTLDDYGWSSKAFEVLDWELSIRDNDNPVPVINMVLKETASTIYDFDVLDEVVPDPAPNTNLPDAFSVLALQGFSLSTRPLNTEAGDTVYIIVGAWDTPDDTFVVSGGRVEIQFKESTASKYRPSFFVPGDLTESEVFQGELDTTYDVRIRPVNYLGIPGGFQTITNFIVGSTSGVTETLDYGFFSVAHSESEDYGLFGDSVSETDDFGSFT